MKKLSCFVLLITLFFSVHSVQAQTEDLLVPYRIGDKWGFSNYEGKLIIDTKYDSVTTFSTRNFFEKELAYVFAGEKVGILDKRGKSVIPLSYNSIERLSGAIDYNPNRLMVSVNGKYGIIDYSNKVMIPLEYDALSVKDKVIKHDNAIEFVGYKYLAKKGDVYFTIDEDGNKEVVEQRTYTSENSSAYGFVGPDSYYNSQLNKIKSNSGNIVSRNRSKIDRIGSKTYGDKDQMVEVFLNGKVAIYDSILDVEYYFNTYPEVFLVKRDEKITVVNTVGKELMPLKYTGYKKFNDRFIVLNENGKYGFYRYKDGLEITPKYDSLEWTRIGGIDFWKITLNGKEGYISDKEYHYFKD